MTYPHLAPAAGNSHLLALPDHVPLRPFTAEVAQQLQDFLSCQITRTGDTPSLLELAQSWIARQGILPPAGKTTIERMVYHVRHQAEEELFERIAGQLAQPQRDQLDALCQTNQGKSPLAALAAEPQAASAKAIAEECHRLTVIRAASPGSLDWQQVKPPRLLQWAAIVRRLPAQALRRYPPAKRYTLLLAFLTVRGQEITDVIVDMFDTLIGQVFAQVAAVQREACADQAQTHLTSARIFRRITQVLLDTHVPSESIRQQIFQRIARERVRALVEGSRSLEEDETEHFFARLKSHYPQVRGYTRLVLQTLRFASPDPENPVLKGLEVLRTMGLEYRKKVPKDAPLGFVPQRWLRAVAGPEGVDRRAWELCLLFQARQALRSGNLLVEGSYRYVSWETYLYSPACWQQQRERWFSSSGLPLDGTAYLAQAKANLHTLTTRVAQRATQSSLLKVREHTLALAAREQPALPPEVVSVRRSLLSLLPRIGLPQLLMEVDGWTGFTSAFAHLTARRQSPDEKLSGLRPVLFAVLVAEATNIGFAAMAAASGIPYAQLARVYDWYVREETLQDAITLLSAYYQRLPLAAVFGNGRASSSSALRFDEGGSASPAHPDHLSVGTQPGVTLYSHVSNQGFLYWMGVVNPLAGEAASILDGLLLQDLLPIRAHATQTAGVTDLLFGLCDLLGYRLDLDPRSLPDQPLARAQEGACYGPLTPALGDPIQDTLIIDQWDDIQRLLASLKDRLVAPSLLVSKLQLLEGRIPLREALQEVGRIARTRALLSYVDDASLRQQMLIDLHKAESLKALAQALFFGRCGHFTERGDEARCIHTLILSLVLNAVIVWNACYLEGAAATLARHGQPVPESVWPHLSPILWEHLYATGDYHFGEVARPG